LSDRSSTSDDFDRPISSRLFLGDVRVER
jgi:hypothetical protein